jgi:Smg protein
MFEILIYLFGSYFDAGACPEPKKLSRKLSAAGFQGEEINEVLAWLSALQQQEDSYPTKLQHAGIRCFAKEEENCISFEARQFLLFSEQQEMISAAEREMIIDRTMALKQKNLSLDKLKLIMLMVLWSRDQELDTLLIEELLSPFTAAQLH